MILGFLSFLGLILGIQFIKLLIQWMKMFIEYLKKIAPIVLIIILSLSLGVYYLNDAKVLDAEKLKNNIVEVAK